MYVLGVDPGWASCGLAVLSDGEIIHNQNMVPRTMGDLNTFSSIFDDIDGLLDLEYRGSECREAYIERYVAYKGIHSDMSEKILMFIGAFKLALELRDYEVHMIRAIDWKPKVCKYLVRTQDFKNPSVAFDKKFSLAAAKALSGKAVETDHAADAICLSYLHEIEIWNKENKK